MEFKYSEKEILKEALAYVRSTYSGHYAKDIEPMEYAISQGWAKDSCKKDAIKYISRFGKKEGENELDIFKAIHYLVILLHTCRKEQEEKQEEGYISGHATAKANDAILERMRKLRQGVKSDEHSVVEIPSNDGEKVKVRLSRELEKELDQELRDYDGS